MTKNAPLIPKIPLKIQNDPELFSFFETMTRSLYQVWFNISGNNFPALISTTKSIDVTSTGTTELFKVPENKIFIPLFVVIRVVDFTLGGKSTQAIASFGGNSPNFNDFLSGVTYTVNNVDTFQIDRPSNALELVQQSANTSFSINIDTASNASVEKWNIDLLGYMV